MRVARAERTPIFAGGVRFVGARLAGWRHFLILLASGSFKKRFKRQRGARQLCTVSASKYLESASTAAPRFHKDEEYFHLAEMGLRRGTHDRQRGYWADSCGGAARFKAGDCGERQEVHRPTAQRFLSLRAVAASGRPSTGRDNDGGQGRSPIIGFVVTTESVVTSVNFGQENSRRRYDKRAAHVTLAEIPRDMRIPTK